MFNKIDVDTKTKSEIRGTLQIKTLNSEINVSIHPEGEKIFS